MEGFKIKSKSNGLTTRYAQGVCRIKGNSYLIQVNKVGDQWHMVSASSVDAGGKPTPSTTGSEAVIDGNQVYLSDKFHCPSCKCNNIVCCGVCGKIACWDGVSKKVICPHCKHEGVISGRMKSLAVEPVKRKGNENGTIKHIKPKHSSTF